MRVRTADTIVALEMMRECGVRGGGGTSLILPTCQLLWLPRRSTCQASRLPTRRPAFGFSPNRTELRSALSSPSQLEARRHLTSDAVSGRGQVSNSRRGKHRSTSCQEMARRNSCSVVDFPLVDTRYLNPEWARTNTRTGRSSFGDTLTNVDEPARRSATVTPRTCSWRQRCAPNIRFSFGGPTHRAGSHSTAHA